MNTTAFICPYNKGFKNPQFLNPSQYSSDTFYPIQTQPKKDLWTAF